MQCFQCHKEIENELDMIFINIDGDIVCSKKCQQNYEKEKQHFFDVLIHDEEKCKQYILGV